MTFKNISAVTRQIFLHFFHFIVSFQYSKEIMAGTMELPDSGGKAYLRKMAFYFLFNFVLGFVSMIAAIVILYRAYSEIEKDIYLPSFVAVIVMDKMSQWLGNVLISKVTQTYASEK